MLAAEKSPKVEQQEPKPLQIKEEQEEPGVHQDGEQLLVKEETDTRFPLTDAPINMLAADVREEAPEEPCPGEAPEEPCPGKALEEPCPGEAPEEPSPREAPEELSPGEAPEEPCPGEAPEEPCPGKALEEPCPGEAPEEPSPGEAPEEPSPGEAPEEPSPGEAPEEPCPGEAPEEPCPGEAPEEPSHEQEQQESQLLQIREEPGVHQEGEQLLVKEKTDTKSPSIAAPINKNQSSGQRPSQRLQNGEGPPSGRTRRRRSGTSERGNGADRRIITCLKCFRPQNRLSFHLRICMKNKTNEERKAELDRAKKSMKAWTLRGRTWDYNVMVKRYPDEATRQALLEDLRERNFLIFNDPMDVPAESSDSPPGAAVKTHNKNRCRPALPTLQDCQRVLRVSHDDILDIQRRLLDQQHVEDDENTLFRYFCEAILVLRYFQRPDAVMALTASDWLNKKHVEGRIHMGISKNSETISLTEEDSAMLDTYFHKVRSGCLQGRVDDQARFFLSKQGKPVGCVSTDLKRLHEQYELPSFLSREVCEAQRSSTSTCSPSDEPANNKRGQKRKRGRGPADQHDKDFGAFYQRFPATASSSPPTKKKLIAAGFPPDRAFYDRWRSMQLAQREKHLLSQFAKRPPTVSRVSLLIKKEGWTSNCPRPKDVVAKWKPVLSETDPWILAMIDSQKWTGMALKHFGCTNGQGVVAIKHFAMGSIVCDYHGKVITAAEGRKIMESTQDDTCKLLFFHGGGRDLCADARTFPCECHPTGDPMGRRISHSSDGANLRPVHYRLNFPGGLRDVIILRATRDIEVCEELLLNYGLKCTSSRVPG
ncbi:uncharacterized protein si:dkey-23a23.2 isoform X2 [Fundulus heteroclitus]|uniref:uncharacterized protein si:dkey-23a23.2 isoform X2 n=1 Tax=Fundulus heteroclitus TaxID=8078 RepID=UPI00165A27AF|nr:uncharacterized protein si:dkey-23a23.2 isoform X2 [Fundulus heteroclitus]